jgi:uncharacterized protein (TIGR03435 family)
LGLFATIRHRGGVSGERVPLGLQPLTMMEGTRDGGVVTIVTAKAQPISALTQLLSREFQMPISDQTGLQGVFDFQMEFAPRAPGAISPNPEMDVAPNLLTAVQQQLGLRLNGRKVPTDVIVVEHADMRPAGN